MSSKKSGKPEEKAAQDENLEFPGYQPYPASEDIYYQFREESEIDPEDPTKRKVNETKGVKNEKDFEEDVSGGDLDIPGAELDDANEAIGSEDEENNHYSLGGDNHEDLEESRNS